MNCMAPGLEFLLSVAVALSLAAVCFVRGDDMPATPTELITQADNQFDARNFPTAIDLYQRALAGATAMSDTSTQLEAMAQLARCHLTQNLFDGAKEWLEKAAAIASKDYPAGYARYLGVRGRLEWREGRNDNARELFMQMYDLSNAQNLPARAIDACRMMAIVGTPQEQIDWGRRGIAAAEQSGLLENLASLWNNLAASYGDQGDYVNACDAFLKAREYHWRFGNEIGKLYADYQVGWALRMKGDLDQALTWLRPSLAWAERLGNDDVEAQACEDLGEIAFARSDFRCAAAYLKRALEHFVKAGYPDHSPEKVAALEKRITEAERRQE